MVAGVRFGVMGIATHGGLQLQGVPNCYFVHSKRSNPIKAQSRF